MEADQWIGVTFDGNTGVLRHVELPSEKTEQTGDVITRWLYDLHMARVWGLPFRIFVCVMGLVVTMFTVTGLVIWWRKRRVRVKSPARPGAEQTRGRRRCNTRRSGPCPRWALVLTRTVTCLFIE